jgi:hypothetical protein
MQSASDLACDAAVTIMLTELSVVSRSFMLGVAILTVFPVPVYAQEQRTNMEKLKADAQNVFKIISGDKLKTRTYCEIADLTVQLAQATRKKDSKKVEKLAQNIGELESKLGPEYPALLDGLWSIEPASHDAKEIGSILDKLDDLCGN